MFSGFKYCPVLSMARPFLFLSFSAFVSHLYHFTSHSDFFCHSARFGCAGIRGGALRISESFVESSGTILQDSDGENELFHLGFDHGGLCN